MTAIRSALTAVIFSLLPLFAAAQTVYSFPDRVTVGRIPPAAPNSTRNEEMPMSLLQNYADNFHPIGWSADGKAAYLTWSESQFTSSFGVVVYDAVKDTVAGQWFEKMGDNIYLDPEQLPFLWKRDRDSIVPLLERFHIVQLQDTTQYSDFPARFGDREFSMEYTLHPSAKDERFYEGISGDCIVTQNNTATRVAVSWGGFHGFNVQPVGLWMSPDQRFSLAIIMDETGAKEGVQQPYFVAYSVRAFPVK